MNLNKRTLFSNFWHPCLYQEMHTYLKITLYPFSTLTTKQLRVVFLSVLNMDVTWFWDTCVFLDKGKGAENLRKELLWNLYGLCILKFWSTRSHYDIPSLIYLRLWWPQIVTYRNSSFHRLPRLPTVSRDQCHLYI